MVGSSAEEEEVWSGRVEPGIRTQAGGKTEVDENWREMMVTRVKRRERKAHEGLVQVPRTTPPKVVFSDSIIDGGKSFNYCYLFLMFILGRLEEVVETAENRREETRGWVWRVWKVAHREWVDVKEEIDAYCI